MKYILLAILILAVSGCTICTKKAIRDCEEWQEKGYTVRILQYPVGIDGLLAGAFVWRNHAQCQVFHGQSWQFVGEFGGLSERPTFSMAGLGYWYELSTYREAIYGKEAGHNLGR